MQDGPGLHKMYSRSPRELGETISRAEAIGRGEAKSPSMPVTTSDDNKATMLSIGNLVSSQGHNAIMLEQVNVSCSGAGSSLWLVNEHQRIHCVVGNIPLLSQLQAALCVQASLKQSLVISPCSFRFVPRTGGREDGIAAHPPPASTGLYQRPWRDLPSSGWRARLHRGCLLRRS